MKLQNSHAVTCLEAQQEGKGQDRVGTLGLAMVRLTCPVGDASGCGCVGASHSADLKGVEGPRAQALIGEVGDTSEHRAVLPWVLHGAKGQQVALSRCLLPAGQQAVGAAQAGQAHT